MSPSILFFMIIKWANLYFAYKISLFFAHNMPPNVSYTQFLQILRQFLQILKVGLPKLKVLPGYFAYPGCNGLSHALLEGEAEGAVASVAAFAGQLLGCDGLMGSNSLSIETHEVVDAQVVDVGIVGSAMAGEKLAEIKAVDANSLGQLAKGQVMLQVKLRSHTALIQQLLDIEGNGQWMFVLCRKP